MNRQTTNPVPRLLAGLLAIMAVGCNHAPAQKSPEDARHATAQQRELKEVFAEHNQSKELYALVFQIATDPERSRRELAPRYEEITGYLKRFADDVRTLERIRTIVENDPLGIAITEADLDPTSRAIWYFAAGFLIPDPDDVELFWDMAHAMIWISTAMLAESTYFENHAVAVGTAVHMFENLAAEMQRRELQAIPPRVREALRDLRRTTAIENFAVYLHESLLAICDVLEDPDIQLHEDYLPFRTSFAIQTQGPHTDTRPLRNVLRYFPPDPTPENLTEEETDAIINRISSLLMRVSDAYIYVREAYGWSKEVRQAIDDLLSIE